MITVISIMITVLVFSIIGGAEHFFLRALPLALLNRGKSMATTIVAMACGALASTKALATAALIATLATTTSCGDTSIGGDTVSQQDQGQTQNEPLANCTVDCSRNITTGLVTVATTCEATGSTTIAIFNSLPDNCSRIDEVEEPEEPEQEFDFDANPQPTPGLQDGVI